MSNVTLVPLVGAATLAGAAAQNLPNAARLYLSEFGTLTGDQTSGSTYPRAPALADQVLAFGNTSVPSAPFSAQTRVVRVHVTGACCVAVGPSPVASGTQRMVAGQTEWFAVQPGHAVAVATMT